MGTTTVRLTDEEAELLDEVAAEYGGRSNALRAGLRDLVSEVRRRRAFDEFIVAWEHERGSIAPADVTRMVDRFGL